MDVTGPRHLVEDVQRFGLASAAAVVDRYIHLAGRSLGGRPGPAEAPSGEAGARPVDETAARLTDTMLTLLDTLADLGSETGAHVDDAIVLPSTAPGSSTAAPAWVHNPTIGRPRVAVTATSMAAPSGHHIPASAVSTSPAETTVEATSSVELELRVEVPEGQAPGVYRGLLLLSVAPDDPVGLVLRVIGP